MIRFAVGYWGSHPDEENDDLWTSREFNTLDEARAAFNEPVLSELSFPAYHVAFVTLDVIADEEGEYTGPDVSETRPNPSFDKDRRDRDVRVEMTDESEPS